MSGCRVILLRHKSGGHKKGQENQHVPQFEQRHCGLPGRAGDGMDVAVVERLWILRSSLWEKARRCAPF